MKLLLENWRKYVNETDKPTSHPPPSNRENFEGAAGKFKQGIYDLIGKFEPRQKKAFIDGLWALYRSAIKQEQDKEGNIIRHPLMDWEAPEIINNIVDELEDDWSDALIEFGMLLTGPSKNWPEEENV